MCFRLFGPSCHFHITTLPAAFDSRLLGPGIGGGEGSKIGTGGGRQLLSAEALHVLLGGPC